MFAGRLSYVSMDNYIRTRSDVKLKFVQFNSQIFRTRDHTHVDLSIHIYKMAEVPDGQPQEW